MRNLVDVMADLGKREVDLIITDQAIDTSTPGGRLVFHVLAAIAESERELTIERTKDGLANTKARGRSGGRKHKLTADQMVTVRKMAASKEHSIAGDRADGGSQPSDRLPSTREHVGTTHERARDGCPGLLSARSHCVSYARDARENFCQASKTSPPVPGNFCR